MKTDFVPSYFRFFFFFDQNRGNLYPLVPVTPPIALRKHSLGLGLATIMLKS